MTVGDHYRIRDSALQSNGSLVIVNSQMSTNP